MRQAQLLFVACILTGAAILAVFAMVGAVLLTIGRTYPNPQVVSQAMGGGVLIIIVGVIGYAITESRIR